MFLRSLLRFPLLPGRFCGGAWRFLALWLLSAFCCAGCDLRQEGTAAKPEVVWGRRGYSEGRFQRPRTVAVDGQDQLYIVDMTGRIQVFDGDGQFLRSWNTPTIEQGKPTGMSFDNDGHLMVADTHYFRVLFYTREGKLLPDKTIGGTLGFGPGEFNFVTDVVQDSEGHYYISEYGEYDRIQKFSADGKYLMQWGGHGTEPGKFMRPQSMAIDEQNHLWVADACNHRVQVFDVSGTEAKFLKTWGEQGREDGKLRYPYGLVLADDHVYLCEYGNHRVQKFTRDGGWVASWGAGGKEPGELNQPWAIARDSGNRFYVLDSYNHRVQRFQW